MTAPEIGLYVMLAGNMIGMLAAAIKLIAPILAIRDDIRDMKRDIHNLRIDVGTTYPPSGLIGEMMDVKTELNAAMNLRKSPRH